MAKKKSTAYDGLEIHVQCFEKLKRTRLADRTLVRCPKCNFLHVSIDDEKIREINSTETDERKAKLQALKSTEKEK